MEEKEMATTVGFRILLATVIRSITLVFLVLLAGVSRVQAQPIRDIRPPLIDPLPQVLEQPTVPRPVDGSLPRSSCTNFMISLGLTNIDIPDPGWTWVRRSLPSAPIFRSVTGVVTRSKITHTDFPTVHDSHDTNIDIRVDPGQQDILSNANPPNNEDSITSVAQLLTPTTIELEWEIGTFPNERGRNAPERFFPKWAWPSEGDRVWADGHWVFDCGHGKSVGGKPYYRTELHPVRAIASMRNQVVRFAPAGNRPVPVTATDLYIHGRGGYIVDILNCGQSLILSSNPDSCPTKTTPIADDYEFFIPAPPKPIANVERLRAVVPNRVAPIGPQLRAVVQTGPGNTLTISPQLELRPNANPPGVHVKVPLRGSGAQPTDVYARTILVGWDTPPNRTVRHFRVTLNRMDLHNDHDTDPGDCECTFFWMNVDKASAREWIRLVDFARGNMNDYDDDKGLGDGYMNFSGATFEFFLLDGETFRVKANGYDQDCLDNYFGDHRFRRSTFLNCYLAPAGAAEPGDNDAFKVANRSFGPPYPTGRQDVPAGGEYELELHIERLE
jgi:hypothetical protein